VLWQSGVAGDVPAWFVRGVAFLFGALWGSFFNVAIYRWPRGMSVVTPPSHCPACGAPVRWRHNLPIVGYLILRGRADCCGAKLTPRYAWVELLTAVLFVAVAEQFLVRRPDAPLAEGLLEVGLYWMFVGGLIIATFVDLEWMEIPDEVSLPGAALGLATVGLRSAPGPVSAAVGAGVGFLVVQILFIWIYERLMGRRGMGEGDAKLLLMIGAFLGWEGILFTLLAGSVQGLIVAGIAMSTGLPLIPVRPDEPEDGQDEEPEDTAAAAVASSELEGVPASVGEALSGAETAPLSAPAAAPMMVFGPMLALASLEYLFFGDLLRATLQDLSGG
jgi:leader peptidase (prepilin peptidase)/N-methyltransferase